MVELRRGIEVAPSHRTDRALDWLAGSCSHHAHTHTGAPAARSDVELAHVAHLHPFGMVPVVNGGLGNLGFRSSNKAVAAAAEASATPLSQARREISDMATSERCPPGVKRSLDDQLLSALSLIKRWYD